MGPIAEIIQRSGSWTFDGAVLRIVPAHGRGVHALRAALGELVVPLAAVGGISYEPGRRGGRLRLRPRSGADPFTQATAGRLPDAADPYRLEVEPDRSGVAEYLVEQVRLARELEQVPDTPADRYLLPGPAVPLGLHCSDAKAAFDGERITIEWGWAADESKRSGGGRTLALADLEGVDWTPPAWENGVVRLRPRGARTSVKPAHDPNCVVLRGWRQAKETAESAMLVAAITARLPHPAAGETQPPALPAPRTGPAAEPEAGGEHDALLRRLRELAELHRTGVLTDEEFSAAKKAVIDRL